MRASFSSAVMRPFSTRRSRRLLMPTLPRSRAAFALVVQNDLIASLDGSLRDTAAHQTRTDKFFGISILISFFSSIMGCAGA